MNINQTEKDNLFKGLGLFLEAIRLYVITLLQEKHGESWAEAFAETLSDVQRQNWNLNLQNGKTPESQIDFHHLKFFAIKNKELLKRDFGKKTNSLPNWFEEIAEVRHNLTHYATIDKDAAAKAWINMKQIANLLGMTELEAELIKLKEANSYAESETETSSNTQPQIPKPQVVMPWFRAVTPHLDIRQGRLDESVFAANLSEVALGIGREIYNNSALFFSKTFFTTGLKNIARTVIKGLNGKEDAENRVISLQTGFGGGKTHTLISLFHLCKMGKKAAESAEISELTDYAGTPEFDSANIAVFTNTTNDAAQGRKTPDGILIQTIWGELAYQLGGKEAYEIVRQNDEQLISPAGLFKKVLEKCRPALILIDELADYCVKASARTVGNSSLADQTISFMQELTEAISGTNNCVAIITLPASPQEVGNTVQAHQILSTLENRVRRVGSDITPVTDEEIYEVVRRRLFENIGDQAHVEAVVSAYMRMFQENWMEMPSHATRAEYREILKKSYPFHPELIDAFRIRWASHHGFQRTRGVLRLLAAIVSDLWRRQDSLGGKNLLIDAGDVNFSNIDALSSQLKTLFGHGFEAVITADVSGSASNAFKIDEKRNEYGAYNLAKGIASVILLNSFGTDGANRGISVREIKLNLLEPEGFNHNNINTVLDEFEAAGYYLYYAQSGHDKRYWFHTKPNINILINQMRNDIDNNSVEAEIIKRITAKSRAIQPFKVLIHPTGDVPEQKELTLIILNPQFRVEENKIEPNTREYIEKIATKKGNSERIYRNTMLFLGINEHGLIALVNNVKEYLACEKISRDYASQLEREQKEELRKKIEEASKQVETALVNAYSTVLKYSVKNGLAALTIKQFHTNFEGQINNNVYQALKTEEWLLESIGLRTLQRNNLLPTPENPVKVKDAYEAFLRFDDKPMIANAEAVRKSLIKYCSDGHFCIASGDGKEFTRFYLQENVPHLDVEDASYWLVEKSLKPGEKPIETKTDSAKEVHTATIAAEKTTTTEQKPASKTFAAIVVSGKVPLENYSELFNCFIAPFSATGNKIEIEFSFKINSSESNPLTESSPQYKNAKEAAKQLGLAFSETLQ